MRSLPQLLLRWAAHCEVADLKYTLQGPVDAEMETMKIVRQSADEIDASSAQVENDAEKTPAKLEITWSCGICEISCLTQRTRKYEFELWTNAAQILAEQHLRRKPTLPSDDVNVDDGNRLLHVPCAFKRCTWNSFYHQALQVYENQRTMHPWDMMLQQHILEAHADIIDKCIAESFSGKQPLQDRRLDVYNQAIAIQERQQFPTAGYSVDRRAFEYTQAVFNDESTRALICSCCACIKLDTGGKNSRIEFVRGGWFFKLPRGSIQKNFAMDVFTQRYRQPGSPLAFTSTAQRNADFTDWQLELQPSLLAASTSKDDLWELDGMTILCCPEDHQCSKGCAQKKKLCDFCELPVCRDCQYSLEANKIVDTGLCNDNWYGYVEQWIYKNKVTWMEKTCATPFWTGLMLFCVDSRNSSRRRKHLMHSPLFQPQGRVFYKGQIFSAPMDWPSMVEQLQKLEKEEPHISLPVMGEVLAARVRIAVSSGLVDLNALIKQATVRRNIVVQLIRMHHDANHPDYKLDMACVERQAKKLTPTDEPTIPNGLMDLLGQSMVQTLQPSNMGLCGC